MNHLSKPPSYTITGLWRIIILFKVRWKEGEGKSKANMLTYKEKEMKWGKKKSQSQESFLRKTSHKLDNNVDLLS